MNTAKLKAVPRHSVDGYGRQDICYNDPEGEFVFYSDYEVLIAALEAAQKRIAELEACVSNLQVNRPVVYGDGFYEGYWKARSEQSMSSEDENHG